jgi:hypothetical protein
VCLFRELFEWAARPGRTDLKARYVATLLRLHRQQRGGPTHTGFLQQSMRISPIEAIAAGLVLRSVWVIPVLVGKLFARENLIFLRQELIERRALGQAGCPLASVGEREERAFVV